MSAPQTGRKQTTDERSRIERAEYAARIGVDGMGILVDMLSDPSWMVRRRVVALLSASGPSGVEPLLRALVGDRRNESTVAAVVDALSGTAGDPTKALIELASHPDPAVSADAAQILGRRGSREAIPTLSTLALASDDNVALAAIEALGRVGGRAAVECLVMLVRGGNFFRTFPAIDVLGRSGDPRAVGPLAELVADARYALEAMRALARTGQLAAVRPLVSMILQPSLTVRRVAAVSLSELVRAYADKYGFESSIEDALAAAAAPGAARRLAATLPGASDAEQEAIAHVLGLLGDVAAVTALTGLIEAAPAVSKAAIEGLGRLGSRARNELRVVLREGDSPRRLAILPLVNRGVFEDVDVVPCLSDPDGNVRAMAVETLAKLDVRSHIDAIFALLEDPNARVVQAAVSAIVSMKVEGTEERVLAALGAPKARVRCEALRIVRHLRYGSALERAVDAVGSDDDRLREAALLALAAIDDPRAEETLIAQSRASDDRTRAIAARALGQRPPTDATKAALKRAATDEDPWVRYYGAQALGKVGDDAFSALLEHLLKDIASQVRLAAVEALAHLATAGAIEALKGAARSDDDDLRRAALMGLGISKRPDSIPLLMQGLQAEDAATRLVATSAIANFEAPGVLARLGRMARDADRGVSLTALRALAERSCEESTIALAGLLDLSEHTDIVRLALSAPSAGRITGIFRALETADDEKAAMLTSALSRMRTKESTDTLLLLLQSGNIAARKAAAVALGATAPSGPTLDALRLTASKDADLEVRAIAALASSRG